MKKLLIFVALFAVIACFLVPFVGQGMNVAIAETDSVNVGSSYFVTGPNGTSGINTQSNGVYEVSISAVVYSAHYPDGLSYSYDRIQFNSGSIYLFTSTGGSSTSINTLFYNYGETVWRIRYASGTSSYETARTISNSPGSNITINALSSGITSAQLSNLAKCLTAMVDSITISSMSTIDVYANLISLDDDPGDTLSFSSIDISNYFIVSNCQVYTPGLTEFSLYNTNGSLDPLDYTILGFYPLNSVVLVPGPGTYVAVLNTGATTIFSNTLVITGNAWLRPYDTYLIDFGYGLGYDGGYVVGSSFGRNNNLISLMWATFKMPFELMFGTLETDPLTGEVSRADNGLFSFTFLGVDIRAFVLGIISLVLVIRIIGLILGNLGKN